MLLHNVLSLSANIKLKKQINSIVMKRNSLLSVLFCTLVLSSCGGQKALQAQMLQMQQQMQQPVQQPVQQQQPAVQQPIDPYANTFELPCVNESMDNEDYFAALGTMMGARVTINEVRKAALKQAQDMIKQRLGGFVQGVSSSYSRSVSSSGSMPKLQGIIEDEMNMIIEEEIQNAQKVCEKIAYEPDGINMTIFLAIHVPKAAMINKMADAISENEELEIEFNREKFREFAKNKAAELKAAQKEKENR